MKKHFLALTLAAFAALSIGLTSCSDSNVYNPEPAEDPDYDPEYELPTGDHGIVFPYAAYVSPAVESEFRNDLMPCLSNVVAAVGPDTYLIVLDRLGHLADEALVEAYNNGSIIAVVKPDRAEIAAFVNSHPELGIFFTDGSVEYDAYLYYFSKDATGSISSRTIELVPDLDAEDGDELDDDTPLDRAEPLVTDNKGEYYSSIGSWLSHLMVNKTRADTDFADNNSGLPSVESIASRINVSKTFKFTTSNVIRHGYELSGEGSLTVEYDLYQIHVYEGNASSGNYYMIKSTVHLANGKMYKGKHTKYKYGSWARIIGYICDYFEFETHLMKEDAKTEVTQLQFPASCPPAPEGQSGKTEYTNGREFHMGLEAGWCDEEGGNAKANFGASWSNSETRSVDDFSVSERTAGAVPAWRVSFYNVPEYSSELKFKEQKGVESFKSTRSVSTQWVWYDRNAKDNVDEGQHCFLFKGEAKYYAMSFISSKADLKKLRFKAVFNDTLPLMPAVNTYQKGGINLVNKSGTYIEDIKVINNADGKTVGEINRSFEDGKVIPIGWYQIPNRKYTIQFSIGNKDYVYKRATLPLENMATIDIFSDNDFVEK